MAKQIKPTYRRPNAVLSVANIGANYEETEYPECPIRGRIRRVRSQLVAGTVAPGDVMHIAIREVSGGAQFTTILEYENIPAGSLATEGSLDSEEAIYYEVEPDEPGSLTGTLYLAARHSDVTQDHQFASQLDLEACY